MDSFFGIGMPELILILVIAGVVMGPERIGQIARWLGKTTAQLQAISRGFVQQLQNEIDGIDDGEALKGAMSEVQALRQELESLRSDFTAVSSNTTKEGRKAIKEIENSIRPPSLMPKKTDSNSQADTDTAVSTNGTSVPNQPASTNLPALIDIPDDPE